MSDAAILAEIIDASDAVLVGAGSGLSSSCGYNHYHWTGAFLKYLQPFRDKYGFKSPMDGFYYCFPSLESQWGYYAEYIRAMWELPDGEAYHVLREITKDKDTFMLTTNVDMQADRCFSSEAIRHFQGDFAYLQCRQPCHDELIPSHEIVLKLHKNLLPDLSIPADLVPRCGICSWPLVPWIRDDTFLEGEKWKEEADNHRRFLRRHLIENEDRLLLLELGVGEMTPAIIKLPFWELAMKNENVTYVCINTEKGSAPLHLGKRGIYINEDIASVLAETCHLIRR